MKITIEAEGNDAKDLLKDLMRINKLKAEEEPVKDTNVVVETPVVKEKTKRTKKPKKETEVEDSQEACISCDAPVEEPAFVPGGGEVTIKIEEIRKVLKEKRELGHADAVSALVKSYGVKSLVAIPEEHYGTLLYKAMEIK